MFNLYNGKLWIQVIWLLRSQLICNYIAFERGYIPSTEGYRLKGLITPLISATVYWNKLLLVWFNMVADLQLNFRDWKYFFLIYQLILMGESFQDCSWIQDFKADFPQSQPQNPELGRFLWRLWFNFSLSKDNWPFKFEIVDICWHTACFKIWFSKVQDFGNFELSPMNTFVVSTQKNCITKTVLWASKKHNKLMEKKIITILLSNVLLASTYATAYYL